MSGRSYLYVVFFKVDGFESFGYPYAFIVSFLSSTLERKAYRRSIVYVVPWDQW